MATILEWDEAVRKAYRNEVIAEEYETKATPEAVRKVAYYLKWTDYNIDHLRTDPEMQSMVILLMDFQAMTEDTWLPEQ